MSLPVKDVIKMAQVQLETKGISEAKLNAELIFMHYMGVDKTGYFKLWGTILDDVKCDRYLDMISERAGGKPLQYITGEQGFMGFSFSVGPGVLIPRQDTETLASEAIAIINENKKKKFRVLDLGCGSGAVGISIAKLCGNVSVTLSDIDGAAVTAARRNAAKLDAERVASYVVGNWFEPFEKRFHRETFDFIVSNPPYIKSRDIPGLQIEIREHEPLLALDGGMDGLAYYRKIIPKAHQHLKKDGGIALEIGSDQSDDVVIIAEECGNFREIKVIKDLSGNDRVVLLKT